MLVKVQGVTDYGTDDWLYIGEVEELQISDIIHTADKQLIEAKKNNFREDDYWMFSNEMFGQNHEYIRIACTKRDGHMVSVVFNTVAYICNDSGKTIEKHAVNEV